MLHCPGVMIPGQFGPISRDEEFFQPLLDAQHVQDGNASVMQTNQFHACINRFQHRLLSKRTVERTASSRSHLSLPGLARRYRIPAGSGVFVRRGRGPPCDDFCSVLNRPVREKTAAIACYSPGRAPAFESQSEYPFHQSMALLSRISIRLTHGIGELNRNARVSEQREPVLAFCSGKPDHNRAAKARLLVSRNQSFCDGIAMRQTTADPVYKERFQRSVPEHGLAGIGDIGTRCNRRQVQKIGGLQRCSFQ